MPSAATALNLLFFPSIIAANVILWWVGRQTVKAGIWPTENFFGFRHGRPFQLFAVMRRLRRLIEKTQDAAETRRYRRWLYAIYLGEGLGLFAFAVLLAFTPWLISQMPAPNR